MCFFRPKSEFSELEDDQCKYYYYIVCYLILYTSSSYISRVSLGILLIIPALKDRNYGHFHIYVIHSILVLYFDVIWCFLKCVLLR